ncbi:MAG TPA: Ig-like domain-containing protein [Patescibacteria group bacterium]|nr:Ig-like domain-containing protein [Patescibacteria group bacterium]
MKLLKYNLKVVILCICLCLLFAVFPSKIVLANNPPDQSHSSLSASNQAPADGSSTVNVTVTLQDSSGNPLSGDSVSFTDPNNSTAVFSPSSTNLNSSGQATFTITSTNAQTDNITVTDNSSNTQLSALGQVTFTSITPTPTITPTCSSVGAPDLTSATSNSSGQITINWTAPSSGDVDHYVLVYGTASGQYQYGDPNIGGSSTISFTVNSLSNGTTYYFAIEAANSCSTSSNSNELSAVAGGSPTSTPAPTIDNSTSTDLSGNSDDSSQDTPTMEPANTPTPTPTPVSAGPSSLIVFLFIMGAILTGFVGVLIYRWKFKKISRRRKKSWEELNSNDKQNLDE